MYDTVLRTVTPPGTKLVGYADDILVIDTGTTWLATKRMAETGEACAGAALRKRGLSTCAHKTVTVWLGARERGRPSRHATEISMGQSHIRVNSHQYLGI